MGEGKIIDEKTVSNNMDGNFIDTQGTEGVSAARSGTVPSGKAVSQIHKTRTVQNNDQQLAHQANASYGIGGLGVTTGNQLFSLLS